MVAASHDSRSPSGDGWIAGEQRIPADEAQRVSERVGRVEGALSPGAARDPAEGPDLRNYGSGEGRTGRLRGCEGGLELVHCKVDRFRQGGRVALVAVGPRIVTGQDRSLAVEVVPTGRNTLCPAIPSTAA